MMKPSAAFGTVVNNRARRRYARRRIPVTVALVRTKAVCRRYGISAAADRPQPGRTAIRLRFFTVLYSQRDGRRVIRRHRGQRVLQRSGRVALHPADIGKRKPLPHERRSAQGFKSESRFRYSVIFFDHVCAVHCSRRYSCDV